MTRSGQAGGAVRARSRGGVPAHANTGLSIDPADWPTRGFLAAADLLRRYHRHRVLHVERLGALFAKDRRVVVVGNHALDIVDPLLFCAEVYRRFDRAPHFVAHENGWFKVPVLRDVARHFHLIPSRRMEETVAAVREGGFLMLYPGANREAAMRSYRDEPYTLKWQDRTGFLRVALEADAEVVFVAGVGIDESYHQSRLPTPRALVAWANGGDDSRYRGMRLHFGLLGPHLVPGLAPLPVRITHVVSKPLDLGDRAAALRDEKALRRLHRRIAAGCQRFLDRAVAAREAHSDPLDRGIRTGQSLLQLLGL